MKVKSLTTNAEGSQNVRSTKTAWKLLIAAIILLGAGLRVWKAWTGQYCNDSDFGIVCLMAKHMAEGRHFPVFFYGQPYMGSLEPAFSALLCKLFGISSFVVCLGTALLSIAVLPLIYSWGKAAGGRWAGLFALLFCLVGSDAHFHYSVAPRGGYMTMMVGGLLSVWFAIQIARRLSTGGEPPRLLCFGLGLAAGAGWWSTQLVLPFLLAAASVLLAVFRRSLMRHGTVPSVVGFVLGSFPWWFWNFKHQWLSFDFASSFSGISPPAGIRNLIPAFLHLVEMKLDRWWNAPRLVLLTLVLGLFAWITTQAKLRREKREQFVSRLAALVMLLSMALLYARSDYGIPPEPRYLLPMFPALAVAVGTSCAWILARRGSLSKLAWVLFIALIPKHTYEIHRMPADLRNDRPEWQRLEKMAASLAPLCDVAVGDWGWHMLNFVSGERLTVACLPKERYGPYAVKAELGTQPAFLNDFRRIRAFLQATRGSSRQALFEGAYVDYALTSPPDDWRYLDISAVTEVRDNTGRTCRTTLTDAVIDTCWETSVAPGQPVQLVVELVAPKPICGLRIFSPDNAYPRVISVEGQSPGADDWVKLLLDSRPTRFFWSGPEVKFEGFQFFQEFRFASPTGGVSQLRLILNARDEAYTVRIGELLFMEQAPPMAAVLPSVDQALAALRQNGVRRVFAPRWLAARIAHAAREEMKVAAPSTVMRTTQDVPRYDSVRPQPVIIDEITGFIVDARDAARSRDVLQHIGITTRETALGAYVLLSALPPKEDDRRCFPLFYWTEKGCFLGQNDRLGKARAQWLFEQATNLLAACDPASALEYLQKAVGACSRHHQARQALIKLLESRGRQEEAAVHTAMLNSQCVPQTPARIQFPGGIEFLGLSLSSRTVAAGEKLGIKYFWTCRPSAKVRQLGVFVHILNNSVRIQDDHPLLDRVHDDDLGNQPFAEIFTEDRTVLIPDSAPPGEYRILIGLVSSREGYRLRPKTDLSAKRRAVELPVTLTILPRDKVPASAEG